MRAATSMTEGFWILKYEPNNIISEIKSYLNRFTTDPNCEMKSNPQHHFCRRLAVLDFSHRTWCEQLQA